MPTGLVLGDGVGTGVCHCKCMSYGWSGAGGLFPLHGWLWRNSAAMPTGLVLLDCVATRTGRLHQLKAARCADMLFGVHHVDT
jgi:hypothetical protein